jgi:acetyltransferase-like isoleucine patch superfamily enzyme
MIISQGDNVTIDVNARIRNSILKSYSRLKHFSELIDSELGDYSYISQFSIVNKTIIGKFCSIANNVSIGLWQHDTDVTTHTFHLYETSGGFVKGFTNFKKDNIQTVIGNDVWIGSNSVIMKGVKIGDGVIIGAGSIVTKDVPDYAISIGTPSKILKFRFDIETISLFKNTKWWDFEKETLSDMIEFGCFTDINLFKEYINTKK